MKSGYATKFFLIVLTLVLWSGQVMGGLFDDRYPSARVMSMGGAGVATLNGVWSPYYNPAALSRLNNAALGTSYQRLYNLAFFRNFFGGAAMPISDRYGSVSVNAQYFGVDYEGENLTGEFTFAVSHGFYLLKDVHSSLSFGYSLKSYYLSYGTSVDGLDLGSTTAFGLDVGFQASVYSRTFVGLYFLNLNNPKVGQFTKHELPQRIVVGVAYQPYDGVTTTFDLNRLLTANDMEFWGGAEFQVMKYLSLRFGATTNPGRFTAGLGLEIDRYQLEYGMRTHSELGETHTIGLNVAL
ncbi:MAG: hypothetical protein KDI06_07995 [Calditrichaeota bacterium]|nr:hypothetical protein [Calditrichota bacterium]